MAERELVDDEFGALVGAIPLDRYRPELAACRERLRDVAFGSGGEQVAAMVGEAKLLRATLVFGSGSPLGAPASALIPAAVSIELLHLASLVHDDIIDGATERRGVPALHVTAGRSRALVVGDLLILGAFAAMSDVRAVLPDEVFAGCVEALGKAAQLCCIGQLEELDPHHHVRSEADYLAVVAKKTGSLFSLAASLGAIIAGAGDDELAALATLGAELGVAYQIRDDLGDSAEDEPSRQRTVRSGHANDVARFSPTSATYTRAGAAALRALARVPAPCDDGLRALVGAML